MKTSHSLAALFCVTVVLGVGQGKDPAPGWTLSGPHTYQNLAIYLVHGKDAFPGYSFLPLQAALEKKGAIVHETGNVNQLSVENLTTADLFIQAGDIVKGGQQDRVLAHDLIVPPRSGKVAIASFCVEAGRWQSRGSEDVRQFTPSAGQLPGKALRLAVSSARDQGQVWEKVKDQQSRLGKRLNKNVADPRSPSSLQLSLEDRELKNKVNAHVARLEKILGDREDVLGAVVAINGNLEGAELYGSPTLFRKMWPQMLRAVAVDAFTEYQPGRRYELADEADVQAFLARGSEGASKENRVTNRVRVITRENGVAFYVETRDEDNKGAILHRSYIAR